MNHECFSHNLRRLRLHKGLTQEQLADIIGISPGYLSQIETPSHPQPLSMKTLFAIADYFKVPPKVFLEFDE